MCGAYHHQDIPVTTFYFRTNKNWNVEPISNYSIIMNPTINHFVVIILLYTMKITKAVINYNNPINLLPCQATILRLHDNSHVQFQIRIVSSPATARVPVFFIILC